MTELGRHPTPPGWFPDPHGGAALRYWDGLQWTAGTALPQGSTQPRPSSIPKPPIPTLPIQAGIAAIVATAASLILSRLLVQSLVHFRWPIAVYSAIAAVVGYGPILVACVAISNRWGTAHLRNDLGVYGRRVDLGWGPVTWLACFAAQVVAAIIVISTNLPFESNTEGLSDRAGDRAFILSFALIGVICAPVIEELVFRGVLMRSLLSRAPVWLALGLQGILFGAAHIDPARGAKNIGLVVVLSAVGVVLGGASYLFRRLTPSMIAHAMINSIALVVILVTG